MDADRFSLSHTPALDGIRGIAIVAVLCSHIPLTFIHGGFLGVEVFFVLSGFLITSLLLREFDSTGRIAFKAFYMRRALRLAPALLLMVAAVNLFVPLFDPAHTENTRFATVTTLAYVTNWSHAFGLAHGLYFGHVWSLSIEEQFYVFFPMLLALLLRTLNRVSVTACVACLGLMSWLWRASLIGQDATFSRIHYGTDTRLDGMLAGCVLALVLSTPAYGRLRSLAQSHRTVSDALSLAAFVLLLLAVWQADGLHSLTYYATFPLLHLSTCFLIWHCVTAQHSAIKRLLAWPPLVWLGKVSYGLYLYHWILIFMLQALFPEWQGVTTHGVVAVSIGVVMAGVSYRYFETPILRHKTRYRTQADI